MRAEKRRQAQHRGAMTCLEKHSRLSTARKRGAVKAERSHAGRAMPRMAVHRDDKNSNSAPHSTVLLNWSSAKSCLEWGANHKET